MRLIRKIFLTSGLGLTFVSSVWAQSAMSAGGFSGWSVSPTARVQGWGTASLAYDNEVVGGPVTRRYGTTGSNFIVGFGFLPNLEASGRIASSTINTNCYSSDCGIRDLSANVKVGAPLDRDRLWHIAAGVTDVGGQTGNFRAMYGVLTYSPDPIDLSLGYGRRKTTALDGSGSPLNGLFGSAAYRPFPWLQTHVEFADSKAWAGARVFAPVEWTPAGWTAHLGLNARLYGGDKTARSWLSAGVTVPLYKVPETRVASFAVPISEGIVVAPSGTTLDAAPMAISSQTAAEPSTTRLSPAKLPEPVTDNQLRSLADALKLKGFEDISVGRTPDGSVAVRVNNASYNVNTIDGLGAALGVIARSLEAQRTGYRLVLMQRQHDIVGVTGQADCLADWIALGPAHCTAGQLYTPGTTDIAALLAEANWVTDGYAPSWTTPRLILQPVLRSAVATEYGVLDHSLALRATLQQPLWRGAWAEVAHNTPLHDSNDFGQGQVFGQRRFINQTNRYMVHQMFRVPVEYLLGKDKASSGAMWGVNAVTAHVAAGQVDANYRGAYGEIRWEPGEGRHRLHVEGGRFERIQAYDTTLPVHSRSLLASYRYAYSPTRTYGEITAGQFLYNDRGVRFGIKQWFDDVAVTLYVWHTKFEWASAPRTSAGIELSIPLTPRKDMSPTYPVQVTGTPRSTHSIETVVRESSNSLSTAQAVLPNVSTLDQTFNSDRSGLVYFEDNMSRVRSAARL